MNTLDVLKEHLSKLSFAFGHHPGKVANKSRRLPRAARGGCSRKSTTSIVWPIQSLLSVATASMQVDCNLDFKAKEVIKEMRQRAIFPSTASS